METEYGKTLEAGLSEDEIKSLAHLKAHYPYRIVYGVVNVKTKEFSQFADFNKRRLNKMVKSGEYVGFLLNGGK